MTDWKLGCNTLYPFGRLQDPASEFGLEAHRRALETLADAGCDGCEFSHYAHLSVPQCAEVCSMAGAVGLEPWSAHAWVPLPAVPDGVPDAVQALNGCLKRAAALEVAVVVVHAARIDPSAGDDAGDRRRQAIGETLRRLARPAGDARVTIAIENCGDWTDVESIVDAVEDADLPHVGFNLDTGHAVLWGMQPVDVLRLMGPRLVTTHLQDNFGERDDHLPPGRGNAVDWPATLERLEQIGYAGMLMVELSDRPPEREPDPPADVRAAVTFLRELMTQRDQANA